MFQIDFVYTLQGTNISPKNGILKMIFLFPRWDMLIPWRVLSFEDFTQLDTLNMKNSHLPIFAVKSWILRSPCSEHKGRMLRLWIESTKSKNIWKKLGSLPNNLDFPKLPTHKMLLIIILEQNLRKTCLVDFWSTNFEIHPTCCCCCSEPGTAESSFPTTNQIHQIHPNPIVQVTDSIAILLPWRDGFFNARGRN